MNRNMLFALKGVVFMLVVFAAFMWGFHTGYKPCRILQSYSGWYSPATAEDVGMHTMEVYLFCYDEHVNRWVRCRQDDKGQLRNLSGYARFVKFAAPCQFDVTNKKYEVQSQ